MIRRQLQSDLVEALRDTPVVLLNGARQVGKSTLAALVAKNGFGGSESVPYVTFDDATVLAAAQSDIDGYLGGLDGPVVIDEAQRVLDVFRAIKRRVDVDRAPGQYLLTGSANVLMLPRLSESLAGRIEVLTLWPFSQSELEGRESAFVDSCFASELPPIGNPLHESQIDLRQRIICGGYPEVQSRSSPKRRSRWFGSYITTVLQRDVRELANIEGLTELPRLLQILAARTSSIVNYSEISRSSGIPASSLKRYLALLKATFLILEIPAWSRNLSKRVVKSPKILMADTGLASHLTGSGRVVELSNSLKGQLFEAFVLTELEKLRNWSDVRPSLFHYRTSNGREVDAVLEAGDGSLVGIEIKAASRVSARDFNGLKSLREAAGDSFLRGIILYNGEEKVAFTPELTAVPIRALWQW